MMTLSLLLLRETVMNNELNNINHNKQQPEILLLQQQGFIDAQNVNDKLLNNAAAAPSPWFISLLFGFSGVLDRKSTRLNSSHVSISYAVFCLKKKNRATD